MKKILFIFKYPTCIQENLKKKFDGEMNACIQMGFSVWYIEWDGNSFTLVCKNTMERKHLFNCLPMKKNIYYHSWYFIDLYKACHLALKQQNYQYIYMRSMFCFPPVMKFVGDIKSAGIRFIMEIPTYPPGNERSNETRWIRKLAFKISGHYEKKVFENVDFFAIMGEPVDGRAYGKPAINIVNGIDIEATSLRHPKLKEDEIHILLLASMSYWHGYDRVIEALKRYKGKENIIIHFVGNDGDGSLKNWMKLVQDYKLEGNVKFHGALYGKELDEIINCSDIGIGTMGLYRENASSGATLKAREYMCRGLPFVYAGKDESIGDKCIYVLQVANDDTVLDMEEIVGFAKQFKIMEDVPDKMRAYARENMSWTVEFQKVFKAISEMEHS